MAIAAKHQSHPITQALAVPGRTEVPATIGLCQARRRSCEARASWVACCGDPDLEDARQSSGETVCTEHLKC